MTKLFEEYETQRLVKSLIGKKFYWSKNFFNGKTFGRKLENEFMIVNCHMGNKTYEVYYEYLMDGLPGHSTILTLKQFATPIDD